MTPDRNVAAGLCDFIDASPSPYHAVASGVTLLEAADFVEVAPGEPVPPRAGGYYSRRGGSLIAWRQPDDAVRAFRIAGAHTDSPNLRIKPRPDRTTARLRQFGVEVYGGALVNSWLDRDLGLSGRVVLSGPDGPRTALVRIDDPLLRIPQLAIHLDREINTEGLRLNPQHHLVPVWDVDGDSEAGFVDLLAEHLQADAGDVVSWDVMTHDLAPSRLIGRDGVFVSAPRLDNLCSCFAALSALADLGPAVGPGTVPLVCLYDHEEIGSTSATGADSSLLPGLVEQVVLAGGGDRGDFLRALAGSVCVSADMAHATHPNYVDRHEPDHHVEMNAGPVVKLNANQRYASDAESVAVFLDACARAGVPTQHFVTRTDLPCGSTIGPVTAARLGIPTVDVGIAQLAMHSAREMCGADDPSWYRAAIGAFLTG